MNSEETLVESSEEAENDKNSSLDEDEAAKSMKASTSTMFPSSSTIKREDENVVIDKDDYDDEKTIMSGSGMNLSSAATLVSNATTILNGHQSSHADSQSPGAISKLLDTETKKSDSISSTVTEKRKLDKDKRYGSSLMEGVRERMKNSGNSPYLVAGTRNAIVVKKKSTLPSSRTGNLSQLSSTQSRANDSRHKRSTGSSLNPSRLETGSPVLKKDITSGEGRRDDGPTLTTSERAELMNQLSEKKGDSQYQNQVDKLQPRKTCNMLCVISYRNLVLIAFTGLVVIITIIIVALGISSAERVSTTSEAYCSTALEELTNTTTSVVLSSASELAISTSISLSLEIGNSVNQATAMTRALSDFFSSVILLPNSNSTCNIDLVKAINLFMFFQAVSPVYQYVDYILFALDLEIYYDYNICEDGNDKCINTRAFVDNSGILTRCPITSEKSKSSMQIVADSFNNQNCTLFPGYNIVQLPEYQLISKISSALGPTSFYLGGWTQFITFPNATLNPTTDPIAGVSYAFPTGFSCVRFECMSGVIGSRISTVSIAQILFQVSHSLLNIMDSNSNPTFAAYDNSVIYVIQRDAPQSGGLLAAFDGDQIAPVSFILAKDYTQSPEISESSIYLESVANFGSSYWDNPRSFIFNESSAQSCDDDAVLQALSGCLSIVTSPINATTFKTYSGAQLNWLVVVVIPVMDFVNQTLGIVESAQQKLKTQVSINDEKIQEIIYQSVVVAVVCIIAGIIVSFILSYVVTKPLDKIANAMQRLLNFDFSENTVNDDQFRKISRVRDVAAAQNAFLSLKDSLEIFSRFVPETVVRNIIVGGRGRKLFVDERVVTIMFSDVKGFTSIAEKLPQQELLYFLVKYLTVMTFIVESFDGVVAEILGDGLLVFWNTPDDVAFHESKACAAALSQQHAMRTIISKEFKEIFERYGLDPKPSIRIGIHTGKVLSGNIGSEIKMKFGCMGDAVNLASRLEGLCKLYGVGITISGSTKDNLPPSANFVTRKLDVVQVKGKDDPTTLYELISMEGSIEDDTPKKKWNTPIVKQRKLNPKQKSHSLRASLRTFSLKITKKIFKAPENVGITKVAENKRVFGPVPYTEIAPNDSANVKLSDANVYESAFEAFQLGNFDDALRLLESIKEKENDEASKILKTRIESAINSSAKDWAGGVNRLNEKNF